MTFNSCLYYNKYIIICIFIIVIVLGNVIESNPRNKALVTICIFVNTVGVFMYTNCAGLYLYKISNVLVERKQTILFSWRAHTSVPCFVSYKS